jgi:thiamine-monophosphate kinase
MQQAYVLSGGDDYELVFTAPQGARNAVIDLSSELKLALTRVGSIQIGEAKLTVLDALGRPMTVGRGFDHFRP